MTDDKKIPLEFNLSTYDYDLDESRIARFAAEPRDSSKLLVVKSAGRFVETVFSNIVDYLREDDILILNDTKVFPARIFGHKSSGAKIEFLLLENISRLRWKVLARPGKRLKIGTIVNFDENLSAKIIAKNPDGTFEVEFSLVGNDFWQAIEKIGRVPLPMYIRREDVQYDKIRYQTVYAKTRGAVAAPTAGLHFTDELLEKIKSKGVQIAFITLNVGWGTFKPIEVSDIRDHKMHREFYTIPSETAEIINDGMRDGRRIVAVGTTTVRALESAGKTLPLKPQKDWTDLFIYPGYEFKIVDCLITNFHLPKSSLLVMVSAFAGIETIKNAYDYAIAKNFRFYSYGDAMMLCRQPADR